ncbi:MAG: carbon-nitrogen hydrolase family protein [Oscillospiraceae bacterium]|nr:carbon-nitrogen hydrolase family protein [Oscillospiraceae bacterium]
MKLAMAQMRMTDRMEENLEKSLSFMEQAAKQGADLIFFPEIQLTPFFPAKEKQPAAHWRLRLEDPAIRSLQDQCRKLSLWASPNVYLEEAGRAYDASLLIDDRGEIRGVSKMVHIAQGPCFFEQDYYTPSDTGFRVYDTPFGRLGIVICFDRHILDSIRACAKQGAELVIIPTANLTQEPMELFAWEIRVQAFQNTVFVAMCNRVGPQEELTFAGESLVAGPDGRLLQKADGTEQLVLAEVPLAEAAAVRAGRPWLAF